MPISSKVLPPNWQPKSCTEDFRAGLGIPQQCEAFPLGIVLNARETNPRGTAIKNASGR